MAGFVEEGEPKMIDLGGFVCQLNQRDIAEPAGGAANGRVIEGRGLYNLHPSL